MDVDFSSIHEKHRLKQRAPDHSCNVWIWKETQSSGPSAMMSSMSWHVLTAHQVASLALI